MTPTSDPHDDGAPAPDRSTAPGTRRRLDVESSRAAWRAANSFAELCRLGERFVAGELAFFPGWNAPDLDEESDRIVRPLLHFHRQGFLTVASQPATPEQHAYVSGFVSLELGRRLARLDGLDDLVVAVFGATTPRASRRHPVSFHDGVAHAFAGHDARADEIECFEDHVSSAALAELRAAAYVSAFDTRIGRDHVLWSALERAIVDS